MAIKFRASADTPRADEIQFLVKGVSDGLDRLVEDLGIEAGTTHIVVADHFTAEVTATQQQIADRNGSAGGVPFTAELGGVVVGKTLAHADDYRDATVLVAGETIPWGDPVGFATGMGLLAHELAHVAIGRSRWASGALEGEVLPSETGTEFARGIARISAEEYRATMLANLMLGILMSVSLPDGESRRLTVHDTTGDCYNDRLVEMLHEVVHPGWPHTVTDYRWGRITLTELTKRIIESTDQVFTLIGHAEAHAEAGGRPRPMPACAGHRGVQLYLAPAWERLIAPARTAAPLPPTLDEVRALEDKIVTEGEAAILAMWSTLGLTVEERENRQWALWVTDPQG